MRPEIIASQKENTVKTKKCEFWLFKKSRKGKNKKKKMGVCLRAGNKPDTKLKSTSDKMNQSGIIKETCIKPNCLCDKKKKRLL